MKLKQTALATALTVAFAMGVSGQASANIYASSALAVSDLTLLITEDGSTPAAGVSVTSFEFTATNTATLNNVSSPTQSITCGGFPSDCGIIPVLDPSAANAPGGTVVRFNGDFSFFGPSGNTYANSDSVISTAQLVTGQPSATQQIAEAELQGSGSARANAEITSNTGFTFTFTIDNSGNNQLFLNFFADPDQMAFIDTLNFLGGSAQTNMTASFTLTNNNTNGKISWSPEGTFNNDCSNTGTIAGTCLETFDTQDLNNNVSNTTNGVTTTNSREAALTPTRFGISISGLGNGEYTLAYNSLTSVSVRQTVPEPGVLALMGLGLAGLGFVTRRRKS